MSMVYFLIQMKRAMTTVGSRIMALTTRSGLERRMATSSVPQVCPQCESNTPTPRPNLRVDLTNQQFGLLHVQHFAFQYRKRAHWCCVCACGNTSVVRGHALTSGNSTSCGCQRLVGTLKAKRTHGQAGSMTRTTLYNRWVGMKARCENPRHAHFADYGGRGITVCPQWRESFVAFASDMGDPPPHTMLERRNNDGPYGPENCYWAPVLTQANNKRNNHWLTWGTATHTIAEWARLTGIARRTIDRRLRLGWDIARALNTPVEEKKCPD